MKPYKVGAGRRFPFGVTADERGVNFSIWGLRSTAAELLLFEKADSREPFQVAILDPAVNRTYYSWHVFVEGLPLGTHYAWRLDGPDDVRKSGFRFDRQKALISPDARAVSDLLWDRKLACRPGDNVSSSMRGIVVSDGGYDWEGDMPLDRPPEQSIIYEMHVGGFTRHSSSKVKHPGTFSGVIEKIPFLKSLGVTDVELMPVMAFDEQNVPEAAAARGLKNFWGYSTHSFFSPHPGYCISPEKGTHLNEFRDMVKALHRAGIGVIMDVVLNHTAEGGADGPTINFKGLGNAGFYLLDPNDRSVYLDFTGCGNTVNCNFPIVTAFLIECLEYWVNEMHVDGFRFDLASVMARGYGGKPLHYAPMPWYIELSDVLGNTRLIAEAWDAGGFYQVGGFPGFRWAEWNGRYRDVIRRFVRGDPGLIGEVATRLSGSSDLYEPEGRLPVNSINFVTCHDGFTLWDLVSYNVKHNEANGEGNRDGSADNASWNCGIEGETDVPEVLSLRMRQAKNFMAVLLLSQGVPMIFSGDEILKSRRGNNNCYCQDNEMGWFDWGLVEKNKDMLRFVAAMISFRRRHPSLMRDQFLTGRRNRAGLRDIAWHGMKLGDPNWGDPGARVLAYTLSGTDETEEHLHIMLNMSDRAVQMELPAVSGRNWYLAVDTSQPSPADIAAASDQPHVGENSYTMAPRSVAVLEAR
jgi:isoamylase